MCCRLEDLRTCTLRNQVGLFHRHAPLLQLAVCRLRLSTLGIAYRRGIWDREWTVCAHYIREDKIQNEGFCLGLSLHMINQLKTSQAQYSSGPNEAQVTKNVHWAQKKCWNERIRSYVGENERCSVRTETDSSDSVSVMDAWARRRLAIPASASSDDRFSSPHHST